ncbi:MAG: GIY-YIG nuclease family protein [Coriobacteriales bacterium]
MTGKHIELFLVEGVPGGITTAEIAGWTGHVLAGPRSELGDVLKRDEAKRNGAYLLLGDDEEAIGGVRCYIGRTEDFINRFRDHSAKKEFWDRVVLITCKDDSFTEGHWGYLEWRLVELAKQAARVTLENSNSPQGRKLSEAQVSDMEAFLEQLQIVLPVLGVNAIRVRAVNTGPEGDAHPSPVFTLRNAKYNVEARAQQLGDEFTMLEGSRVVATWAGTGKAESTRRPMTRTVLCTASSWPTAPCAWTAALASSRVTSPSARRPLRRRSPSGAPATGVWSGRRRTVPPMVTGRTAGWSEGV